MDRWRVFIAIEHDDTIVRDDLRSKSPGWWLEQTGMSALEIDIGTAATERGKD
jgi:hypothetical protein